MQFGLYRQIHYQHVGSNRQRELVQLLNSVIDGDRCELRPLSISREHEGTERDTEGVGCDMS